MKYCVFLADVGLDPSLTESRFLCHMLTSGVFPTMAITDAHCYGSAVGISKKQLWDLFSLDKLVNCSINSIAIRCHSWSRPPDSINYWHLDSLGSKLDKYILVLFFQFQPGLLDVHMVTFYFLYSDHWPHHTPFAVLTASYPPPYHTI